MGRIDLVDNFLSEDVFNPLYDLMSSYDFPWYYNDFIVDEDDNVDDYQFTHTFINTTRDVVSTPYHNFLSPIIEKLSIKELIRVTKPNGKILFVEPLDMNPVGKIVRSLTKKARTADEQPIRIRDIVEIKKYFKTHFFYEEFLSVPFGVLSRMFFLT